MTTNITDVDTFTDPIVAPDDGDAANGATFQLSPQGLANRTYYLKNRVDAIGGYCAAFFTGTAIAQNGTPTVTLASQSGGFSISANEITLPEDGTYIYTCGCNFSTSDTSDPSAIELNPRLNGSSSGTWRANRLSATASDEVTVVAPEYVFTATSGDKITFQLSSGSGNTTSVGAGTNRFTIRRIG